MNSIRKTDKLTIVALAAAVAVLVLVLSLTAPAFAGSAKPVVASRAVAHQAGLLAAKSDKNVQKQVIIEFGDPVNIARGERVDTVVDIGGDITVAGTVNTSVVAIGGNITLLPTAKVGPAGADESSVVVVNGELKRMAGAQVNGGVQTVDVGNAGDLARWAGDWGRANSFHPLGSFVGWLIMMVVCLLLGLIAAVALPDQIRSIERHVATRPGASLGWGALTVFLTPVALIALAITIIGLLVVIPIVIVLPFFTFFVVTAVGTYVIERLFAAQLKGNLILAVVIAVLATSVVSRIPVVGPILIIAMIFIGTGAAVLGWSEWRQRRKLLRAAMRPGPGQPQPPQPPYGPAPQPPYGGPQGPQGPYGPPQPPYGPPPQAPYGQPMPGGPAPAAPQPGLYAPQVYAQPPVLPQAYGPPQPAGQWPAYPPQYGQPYPGPGYWPPPPADQAAAVTAQQPAEAATVPQSTEAPTAEQPPEAATIEQPAEEVVPGVSGAAISGAEQPGTDVADAEETPSESQAEAGEAPDPPNAS